MLCNVMYVCMHACMYACMYFSIMYQLDQILQADFSVHGDGVKQYDSFASQVLLSNQKLPRTAVSTDLPSAYIDGIYESPFRFGAFSFVWSFLFAEIELC